MRNTVFVVLHSVMYRTTLTFTLPEQMHPLRGLTSNYADLCQVRMDFYLFAACTHKLVFGNHAQDLHK